MTTPAPLAVIDCVIWKVQTLSGGGFRITLDGNTGDIAQAAYLMPFADAPGELVKVTFERVKREESCTELNDETKKDAKGSSSKVDSRRITLRRDK